MSDQRYLVAARKYRPQRFSELVAQDHVAETLRNAIRLDRLAHVYLFSGPRGVGKTTAARILAKAINCTGRNEDPEPCRKCTSCKDLESQRSLNIFEIDAASNNKVDDVRELRETVNIPPQGALRKIYIIDEVHMLSNAAFNALLKTLEEPPDYALFIFATTEPHKVLPTILSRCQRFDFRRIPIPAIKEHLVRICAEEHIKADEESLLLIARKGDGAMRDALSAFDQAVALCGSQLIYSDLAAALRVVDVEYYFEAISYIAQRNTSAILLFAERILGLGHDIREFLTGLAEHLRKLLVAVTVGESLLVDVSAAIRARYIDQGALLTEVQILRMLMIADETLMTLPSAAAPRLKLELGLLKMSRLSKGMDMTEALTRLRSLENLAREGKLNLAFSTAAPSTKEPGPAPAIRRTVPPQTSPESKQKKAAQPLDARGSRQEKASLPQNETASKIKSGGRAQPADSVDQDSAERKKAAKIASLGIGPKTTTPARPVTETPDATPGSGESTDAAPKSDAQEAWQHVTGQMASTDALVEKIMAGAVGASWNGPVLEVRIHGNQNCTMVIEQRPTIEEALRSITGNPNITLAVEELPPLTKEQQAQILFEELKQESPAVQALVKHFDVKLAR